MRHSRTVGARPTGPVCLNLDRAGLREFMQLCHPDKHHGSALALKVFQRLQEISKELDKAPEAAVQWRIV